MSQFFVLTDQAPVGPFSGVELREAALAGVLAADAVVGGSASGPWHIATQVGLFTEQKVPIAHPPDVQIPLYHVKGMPGAFQGPFKLRELIGFAVRGMLPLDAELKVVEETPDVVDGSPWLPVRRFRTLMLCLAGDLVMLDSGNRVHLRTQGVLEGASPSRWESGFQTPLEMMRPVDPADSTTVANTVQSPEVEPTVSEFGNEAAVDQVSRPISLPPKTAQGTPRASLKSRIFDRKDQLAHLRRKLFQSPLVVVAVIVLCLSSALILAVSFKGSVAMERAEVIGQWIANDQQHGSPRFGVAFRADGTCTIFNVGGDSWSGDFIWSARADSSSFYGNTEDLHSIVDHREPHHAAGPIEDTDGYMMLRALADSDAIIDGHQVRDLFVRRRGEELQIGYLTEVKWDQNQKRLFGGWVTATRMEQELPSNLIQTLSNHEAHSGLASATGDPGLRAALATLSDAASDNAVTETAVQSSNIDPAYLLKTFGVPDEARRIYGFDLPPGVRTKTFPADQIIRYGNLVLMMTGSGDVHYVRYQQRAVTNS